MSYVPRTFCTMASVSATFFARPSQPFATALRVQTDPGLRNAPRGLLLVYINSLNEWHPLDSDGSLPIINNSIEYV